MSAIKTVLLTGCNNHDWKRSAYFCRDILNATGVFDVTLTETPTESLEDPATLRGCQLIFVDS